MLTQFNTCASRNVSGAFFHCRSTKNRFASVVLQHRLATLAKLSVGNAQQPADHIFDSTIGP